MSTMHRRCLAELSAGSRPEEIKRAQARVSQASFALSELQSGSRVQEIAEAEADLHRAVADERTALSQLELARADFARYEAVFKDGGISRQAFDTYRTQRVAAQNAAAAAASRRQAAGQRLSLRREGSRREQVSQARAALDQAEADYALIKSGPRQEAIDQARARRTAALAGLAIARQQLAETELFCPFDGVVLSTSAEPGAYLNPGTTVLTVADIQGVWLRAFIDETDLGRIRLGQAAKVTIDAYPDRSWKGHISFISSEAEFTPRSVQTFEERTNLVYRISQFNLSLDGRRHETEAAADLRPDPHPRGTACWTNRPMAWIRSAAGISGASSTACLKAVWPSWSPRPTSTKPNAATGSG